MQERYGERSTQKIALLLVLLFLVSISTSMVLSAYPQHLLLDDKTIIEAKVGFQKNNTVNIRGNMVQYSAGDRIPIEGREYIQITGRQVQVGGNRYEEGIRRLTASLTQNVLFVQELGEFKTTQSAQIGVGKTVIILVPISKNAVEVRTSDSSYKVELISGTTYIKSGDVMLRLDKRGEIFKTSLIGIKRYQSLWMKVIG